MKTLLIFIAAVAQHAISLFPNREYHFVYEQKTWKEAQSHCRMIYTDLVTIENAEVVKTLQGMANLSKMVSPTGSYRTWIGLYEDLNTWGWWVYNATLYQNSDSMFRNWGNGTPDNSNGSEICAAIIADGVWDDFPCSLSLKPVCADVNETDVRFVYVNATMMWPAALSYCRAHHTDLAMVRSATENQEIHGLSPNESLWIGLARAGWMWSDRTRRSFTYWREGEPDGPTHCCAAANFASSGMWEDWGCDERIGFICYLDFPVQNRMVRLKLRRPSSPPLDLNNPAVLEELLNKLQQMLKEQNGDVKIRKVSWKKQSDGKVFHKEKGI